MGSFHWAVRYKGGVKCNWWHEEPYINIAIERVGRSKCIQYLLIGQLWQKKRFGVCIMWYVRALTTLFIWYYRWFKRNIVYLTCLKLSSHCPSADKPQNSVEIRTPYGGTTSSTVLLRSDYTQYGDPNRSQTEILVVSLNTQSEANRRALRQACCLYEVCLLFNYDLYNMYTFYIRPLHF